MNSDQHAHDWITERTLSDPVSTYVCRECAATTRGCSECDQPLATSSTICDRCLTRARRIVTDVADAIDTVPFHHAEIMGLRAVRYDRDRITTSADDERLPFGLDRVVEDPEDTRIAAAKHPSSAVAVLVGWAHAWADTLGDTPPSSWATYLVDHTLWAAQNPDTSGWTEYLTEARQVRATVRRLLGLDPERDPVPCVHCGGRIVQDWTERGLDDVHRCTGCGLTWRDRGHLDYANLHTLRELPATHPDALVTVDEARRVLPAVKRNTLNQWVARGLVRPAVDEHGRARRDVRGAVLYRLGDIAARAGHEARDAAS